MLVYLLSSLFGLLFNLLFSLLFGLYLPNIGSSVLIDLYLLLELGSVFLTSSTDSYI